MPVPIKDLTGKRFGRLAIIEMMPRLHNQDPIQWRYHCDCGTFGTARGECLRRGATNSCGCLRVEASTKRATTHGQTASNNRSPTWRSWNGMIERCTKEWHHKYHLYGALGVSVCERWMDFANFLSDMGERPADLTIDRFPNRGGNYEPTNCRWATIDQQNNNKKTNIRINYRGAEMTVAQAAKLAGIVSPQRAASRISRGWSVDRALHTPSIR